MYRHVTALQPYSGLQLELHETNTGPTICTSENINKDNIISSHVQIQAIYYLAQVVFLSIDGAWTVFMYYSLVKSCCYFFPHKFSAWMCGTHEIDYVSACNRLLELA